MLQNTFNSLFNKTSSMIVKAGSKNSDGNSNQNDVMQKILDALNKDRTNEAQISNTVADRKAVLNGEAGSGNSVQPDISDDLNAATDTIETASEVSEVINGQ